MKHQFPPRINKTLPRNPNLVFATGQERRPCSVTVCLLQRDKSILERLVTISPRTTVTSSTFEILLIHLWSILWKQSHFTSTLVCRPVPYRLGGRETEIEFFEVFLFLGFHSSKSEDISCYRSIIFLFRNEKEQISYSLHHFQRWYTYILYRLHYWFSLLFHREEDI